MPMPDGSAEKMKPWSRKIEDGDWPKCCSFKWCFQPIYKDGVCAGHYMMGNDELDAVYDALNGRNE